MSYGYGLYAGIKFNEGIGYKEVMDYYDGKMSFEDAVELIKQSSRRYAKRQLTWFRRDYRIHYM